MSTWHEIIVVGAEKSLRGFVAGFVGGRPAGDVVLIGRDIGVKTQSGGGMLHDLLAGGSHHVLLSPAGVAEALVTAIERTGSDVDLAMEHHLEVVSASFEFEVEVFAPDLAEKLEAALHGSLPPGVSVEDFEEQEETDGEARGAELYSPSHDYTYRASGRVHGPLPGVLEVYRRAKNNDFVKSEPVAIETAELGKR